MLSASPLLAVAMEFEIALMAVMRLDVVARVSHLELVSFPDYFSTRGRKWNETNLG